MSTDPKAHARQYHEDLWEKDRVVLDPVSLNEDGTIRVAYSDVMWWPGPGFWGKVGYFFRAPLLRRWRKNI